MSGSKSNSSDLRNDKTSTAHTLALTILLPLTLSRPTVSAARTFTSILFFCVSSHSEFYHSSEFTISSDLPRFITHRPPSNRPASATPSASHHKQPSLRSFHSGDGFAISSSILRSPVSAATIAFHFIIPSYTLRSLSHQSHCHFIIRLALPGLSTSSDCLVASIVFNFYLLLTQFLRLKNALYRIYFLISKFSDKCEIPLWGDAVLCV